MPAGAVAALAHCLERAGHTRMAEEVGYAVDGNWDELVLAPSEEDEVLSALHNCPASLRPLKNALEAKARLRDESTDQRPWFRGRGALIYRHCRRVLRQQ